MSAFVNPKVCACGLPMTHHSQVWVCRVCDDAWRVE